MDNYKIYYSPTSLRHLTPYGHPECPARLETIIDFLQQQNLPNWQWHSPNAVEPTWFSYAHPEYYIKNIFQQIPDSNIISLDGDTNLSPQSGEAVCFAGGALKDSIDWLVNHQGITLCLSRPPGHHAEKTTAMGFCLFSLTANLALYSQQFHQLKKIAILDFDVHHGNGTEDILQEDNSIFFASSYEQGIFPAGTIAKSDNLRQNIPLYSGIEGDAFRRIWETEIFHRLVEFQPELIIVSAGFDAHKNDPLASCNLIEEDYYWLGQQIRQISQQFGRRIIANLEGGYHLQSLAQSVHHFMLGLQTINTNKKCQ